MVRLFIVDDHPRLRDALRARFAQEPDLRLVGEAGSAEAALVAPPLRAVPAETDLVLIDLALPGMGGIELARRLSQRHPALALLAFSSHDERALVRAFHGAGGRGYLLKSDPLDLLVAAVRAAAAGAAVFAPSLAGAVGIPAAETPTSTDSASPRRWLS